MTTTKLLRPLVCAICFGVLVLILSSLYTYVSWYKQPSVTEAQLLVETKALDANNSPAGSDLPISLMIPSIHVNAKIIDVGLTADGSVGVPQGPYQVAWFSLGPRPGEEGSAVIVGHYGPWKDGAQSVFDNLSALKKGDIIYVKDADGTSLSFVVIGSHIYDADAIVPEVFNNKDGFYLNLITCDGMWISSKKTYNQRLVVFTQETSL